jgi:hypothetical protein
MPPELPLGTGHALYKQRVLTNVSQPSFHYFFLLVLLVGVQHPQLSFTPTAAAAAAVAGQMMTIGRIVFWVWPSSSPHWTFCQK